MAFRIENKLRWEVSRNRLVKGFNIRCDLHGYTIRRTVTCTEMRFARLNIVEAECLRMQECVIREYEAPALAKGLHEWPNGPAWDDMRKPATRL